MPRSTLCCCYVMVQHYVILIWARYFAHFMGRPCVRWTLLRVDLMLGRPYVGPTLCWVNLMLGQPYVGLTLCQVNLIWGRCFISAILGILKFQLPTKIPAKCLQNCFQNCLQKYPYIFLGRLTTVATVAIFLQQKSPMWMGLCGICSCCRWSKTFWRKNIDFFSLLAIRNWNLTVWDSSLSVSLCLSLFLSLCLCLSVSLSLLLSLSSSVTRLGGISSFLATF